MISLGRKTLSHKEKQLDLTRKKHYHPRKNNNCTVYNIIEKNIFTTGSDRTQQLVIKLNLKTHQSDLMLEQRALGCLCAQDGFYVHEMVSMCTRWFSMCSRWFWTDGRMAGHLRPEHFCLILSHQYSTYTVYQAL